VDVLFAGDATGKHYFYLLVASLVCLFVCLFLEIKLEKLYSASCVGRESKPPGSDHTGAKAQTTCIPKIW